MRDFRYVKRDLTHGGFSYGYLFQFYNDLAVIATKFREACKEWVRSRRDEIRWDAKNAVVYSY